MLIARKTSVRTRSNKQEIQNKNGEATVYLYGDIGGWFGIDHQEWIKDFNAIDAGTIHLRIDSDGGDVFAARAMQTAIKQHKSKVIAHVDGLAASAASFLAMGADEIEIVDGGFVMVHKALSGIDIFGYFNEDDLRQVIDDLSNEIKLHGKINETIANDYAKKSGKTTAEALAWMENGGTWFTAQEAKDAGLVDRIYDGEPVQGSYDLSIFDNVPEQLIERNNKLSKRTLERALRDAGLTNKEAKKILAEGFKDDIRDDVIPENPDPPAEPQRDVEKLKPKKDSYAELMSMAAAITSQ
ncbi:MAG: head maturation protease, ClpP-related [Gammaproteobacteria bacterium]